MLACTACFNEAVLFRWPLVDAAAVVFVVWSFATLVAGLRRRGEGQPRSGVDRSELWLAAVGLVLLGVGVFMLSWRMWMQVIALAWVSLLLSRLFRWRSVARWARLITATVLLFLASSAIQAFAAHESPSYMVHWLGRLSPHVNGNSRIAAWAVRQHDETLPLLIEEFEREVSADRENPNYYRISVLARVIGRIDEEASRAALQGALAAPNLVEEGTYDVAAYTSIVLSFARLAGPEGFDILQAEYERRQSDPNVELALVDMSGACVCDPGRGAALIAKSPPPPSDWDRTWMATRHLPAVEQLVLDCAAGIEPDSQSVDAILEQVYPPLVLPPVQP